MDGGGGDFDPCECICSHEGAMRRLISLVSTNSILKFENKPCFLPFTFLVLLWAYNLLRRGHTKLFMMCEFFRFVVAAERFTELLHR